MNLFYYKHLTWQHLFIYSSEWLRNWWIWNKNDFKDSHQTDKIRNLWHSKILQIFFFLQCYSTIASLTKSIYELNYIVFTICCYYIVKTYSYSNITFTSFKTICCYYIVKTYSYSNITFTSFKTICCYYIVMTYSFKYNWI